MKRTVLVTGASIGIGAAIAERFCRDGYQVALHYRSHKQEAETLCARLVGEGLIAAPFYADLQSEEDIEALAAAVHARFGPIDVLINNAGIALPAMLLLFNFLVSYSSPFPRSRDSFQRHLAKFTYLAALGER